MTIKTRTRHVEIPEPTLSQFVVAGGQYTRAQRHMMRQAYEQGAIAALKAIENSHGAILEATYLSDGRVGHD